MRRNSAGGFENPQIKREDVFSICEESGLFLLGGQVHCPRMPTAGRKLCTNKCLRAGLSQDQDTAIHSFQNNSSYVSVLL